LGRRLDEFLCDIETYCNTFRTVIALSAETVLRSLFVVRTHSVFMFVSVPLFYELTLIPSGHKMR